MQNKERLIVLTTGGTIEKTYNELDGSLKNRETILHQRLLSRLRLPYKDVVINSIMAKDSLDLTDEDREMILRSVNYYQQQCQALVILHGTDTMEITAKYLLDHLAKINVPIVLTGAMRPIGFEDSDAPQNFTEALMSSSLLSAGVYVSFHGKIFNGDNVTKDKNLGMFKTLK